jgi:hypothetical protein
MSHSVLKKNAVSGLPRWWARKPFAHPTIAVHGTR